MYGRICETCERLLRPSGICTFICGCSSWVRSPATGIVVCVGPGRYAVPVQPVNTGHCSDCGANLPADEEVLVWDETDGQPGRAPAGRVICFRCHKRGLRSDGSFPPPPDKLGADEPQNDK